MRKAITFFVVTLLTISLFGQDFEGKILYNNVYKSKMPNMTDQQFTAMMGSQQEYSIKDGDYRSVSNGSLFQWQLYVNRIINFTAKWQTPKLCFGMTALLTLTKF